MAVYHRVEQDRTNDWRRVSPEAKYVLTPCSKHAGGVQMMFLRPLSLSLSFSAHPCPHERLFPHANVYCASLNSPRQGRSFDQTIDERQKKLLFFEIVSLIHWRISCSSAGCVRRRMLEGGLEIIIWGGGGKADMA